MNFWVHKSATVAKNSTIGKGTKIWHHSQVLAGARIGENAIIGHNCMVSSRAVLGNNVKLEANIDVWDLVTLEDYVFVGPSAVFTNDLNPRAKYPKQQYPQYGKWLATVVRQGASIGANATVLCGTTIGKHAMIGAGSVVTKSVPDYALIAGVPAKQIGWICECGAKLSFVAEKTLCSKCSRCYRKQDSSVSEVL